MGSFLIGVLTTLAASALWTLVAKVFALPGKHTATWVLGKVSGSGMTRVHRNIIEAAGALNRDFEHSSKVRVLVGRGLEFQRDDVYGGILKTASGRKPHVQILLPNPVAAPRGTDWVRSRERELEESDPSFNTGTLRSQIAATLTFLRPLVDQQFRVRLFDAPHLARVILTDQSAFLNPYLPGRHGRDTTVLQFGMGDVYFMLDRLFDLLWEDSEDIETLEFPLPLPSRCATNDD